MRIKYLTIQDIIEFNVLALSLIQTKKADKNEVLSYQKIREAVDGCKQLKGDVSDKAAFLLKKNNYPTCFCKRKPKNSIYRTYAKKYTMPQITQINTDKHISISENL